MNIRLFLLVTILVALLLGAFSLVHRHRRALMCTCPAITTCCGECAEDCCCKGKCDSCKQCQCRGCCHAR